MEKLSRTTRDRIVGLLHGGKSCRDIARELQCSKSMVDRVRQTIPGVGMGGKRGAVRKLTPRDKPKIIHITHGTVKTPKQVAAALREFIGVDVHPQAVRRALLGPGFRARKRFKKPALMGRH